MPTLYGVCVWGNRVETINNAENERCVMAIINQGANLGSEGLVRPALIIFGILAIR